MVDETTRGLVKPLPLNLTELRALRKVPILRLLNDMIEELHLKLYENEVYQRYLTGVWDEQCIEGSLSADNFKAAEMLRDLASKEHSAVEHEKLATIVKSLGIVLRRYGMSRKERRQTVGGEIISNGTETE